MSEDLSLDDRKRIQAGERADAIIHDPVFASTVERLEKKYIDQWRMSTVASVREDCWALLRALTTLRGELEQVSSDGFVAKAKSKRLASR